MDHQCPIYGDSNFLISLCVAMMVYKIRIQGEGPCHLEHVKHICWIAYMAYFIWKQHMVYLRYQLYAINTYVNRLFEVVCHINDIPFGFHECMCLILGFGVPVLSWHINIYVYVYIYIYIYMPMWIYSASISFKFLVIIPLVSCGILHKLYRDLPHP